MNWMQKSILFLLVLLPFVYWKFSISPYEIPKTWMMILAAVISAVSYVSREFKYGENIYSKTNTWLLCSVVVLVGWLFITSIIGGDFHGSWSGNYYRHDGLLTLILLVVLGLTLRFNNKIAKSLGWGSTLLAILTIITLGNSALLMGNINFLTGYLGVTLPFLLDNKVRIMLQLVAIFLVASWGGIVTGILFLIFSKFGNKKRIVIMLGLITILGVGWLYRVEQIKLHGQGIMIAESRERILSKAAIAISQKPWIGWGWAQFGKVFAVIDYPVHYSSDAYVDRTHSSLMEYGVSGGLPALILYLLIALATTVILWKSGDELGRTLGMVALLYIVHSQTNITSVAEDWLFFAAVGAAVKVRKS